MPTPTSMYVFQNFIQGMIPPDPLLVLTQNRFLPFKILTARLYSLCMCVLFPFVIMYCLMIIILKQITNSRMFYRTDIKRLFLLVIK